MNELDEVIMVGSTHNDYPNGDFVCLCYECGVDFHGPPITICYRCQNQVNPVVFTRFNLIFCVAGLATLFGVLFL